MTSHPDLSSAAEAGRRRWWRVGQNAGAQIVSRLTSGVCQLAMVPVLLHQLGTDVFGWAMALVALVAIAQFADLGVAISLQQALSEAWARHDIAGAQRIYASGARLLLALGVGWFAVAGPAAWWLAPHLLPAPANIGVLAQEVCWSLVVAAACVAIPVSAPTRLAAALQLGWTVAMATAAVNVLTLGAAWAMTRTGSATSPVLFVALLCLAQILPGMLVAAPIARRLGWCARVKPDPAEMRRLWSAALPLAAQNIAGALLQVFTPWAFARFGGFASNAAFTVLQRLFGVVQQAHALVIGPLWPAYAEAAGKGHRAWVTRTFRWSLLLTLGIAGVVAAAAALLPQIFRIWVGPASAVPSAAMTWLVATWVVAAIVGQPFVMLLLGIGRFQRLAWAVTLAHGATLLAMVGLGARLGGTGVALALAGGLAVGVLPLYIWETRSVLCDALTRERSTDVAPEPKL